MDESKNSWKDLTFLQKTSIVIAAAASITSIFFFFMGATRLEDSLKISFCSFVLATTGTIILDRINSLSFENRTTKILKQQMNNPSDLKYVGNGSEGVNWVRRNRAGATVIFNTAFNRSSEETSIPEELQFFFQTVKEILTDKCNWYDIFIKGEENIADSFFASLSEAQKPKYNALIVDSNIPNLQLVVLKHGEKYKILFGWGFHGNSEICTYEGDSQVTCGYFKSYANSLLSIASPYILKGVVVSGQKPPGYKPPML